MDAKKSKKFDVRLIRSKWVMSMNSALKELGAEHQQSSSVSSDTEEDTVPTEKISVQLKSNFPTRNNKAFDWQAMKAALLKEAQIALEAVDGKENEDRPNSESGLSCAAAAKSKPSLCNKRNIEKDKVDLCQKMSDDIDISAYGYDIIEALGTKDAQVTVGATGLSPTSSASSDTSLDSEKLSLRFANLFGKSSISVIDDCNPIVALSKILAIKDFDPLAPQLLLQLVIKDIISLSELSRREDNVINVEIDKQRIRAFAALSEEDKKNCHLSPFLDVSNIIVTHPANEFFTFCSCKSCEEYRELVFRIMADHFRAAHMVVMLLDVLIKAYGPMLKNITAYNKFEKLFNSNKKIYWITTGFYYREMAEHMDFIHDEYLSDNMVFVLFSSILMVNNPLLLLKILAFHVECIVKAYAEGFLEIVDPDQNKIPAEEMLTYILNGYDEIMRISEKVATCLFAFENAFLRKFTLTWKLLCQRLYQQHVYLNLTDTMLACIITLKDEELTSRHAALIKRYIHFDDTMNYVDKRWTDVWIELNKFNLTDLERERRKNSMDVFQIFDTVMQDSIAFALQDSAGESDFYNFASLKNRRLVWHRIMTYAKTKWPKGFFEPPNTLVVEDKCKKCNLLLEYHSEGCKCITCSIAGGPLPPRKDADGFCHKCSAQNVLGEKEVNFYESKILNICTNDDFLSSVKTNNIETKPKNTAFSEVTREVDAIPCDDKTPSDNKIDVCQPSSLTPSFNTYHIAWAVFSHLNNRKRYPYEIVEEAKFCINCKLAQCQLARKILNNEISLDLSRELIRFYQPLSMTREELRSILPNIMFYNRKMIASNNRFDVMDVHDYVVKIYWIYVISIYASYFPCLDNIKKIPLNLQCLELYNNDIRVNVESLKGNKDDTKFIEFLDKIKSLSPYDNDIESKINGSCVEAADSAEMDKKLNDILNTNELNENLPPAGNASTSVITPTTEIQPSHASNVSDSVDCQPKKMCKEKFKKCCFDHNDLGDHCKENHANKKRLRKDCNHARMNETRDRLRKKLSQIVNDRKNNKCNITTSTLPVESQVQPHGTINPSNVKQPQPQAPPTLKLSHPLITNTPITNCDQLKKLETDCNKGNNSLECLNSLCKRLNHLHTKSSKETSKNQQQSTQQPYLENSQKKILLSNFTTQEISASQQHQLMINGCSKTNPKMISQASTAQVKSPNNLDFVSEICELIDNYSKEPVNEQKWIKETLSFIEGSANKTGSSKKSQPQTTNPKKAAKKAKQKQRKEEEKRIAELQDLRGQFYNIYFKEFSEKHYLKILKGSKKRDKKKISELETNIKNLQRAKAKVETAILELIATVKQTNTEFKFSYLPTKEQQMEKVKELESQCETKTKTKFLTTDAERERDVKATTSTSIASINNMNVVPEGYAMPYAHANHFPYNLDYPGTSIPTSSPYDLMRGAPMCYAPPHNQQLTPDVVAAMTANTSCNNNTDPSKRIVTIRRVNLPNVPEPQVTVTAKGSSPDKDKLLYTFINGQLVQTGNTSLPLTPIPTVAVPTVQAVHQNQVSEQLHTVPPPASNLSKTQLKKERRRLAKLVADAESTAQVQTHRLQDDKRYKGQEGVQFQQKQPQQQQQQQQQTQNQQNKSTKKKASIEVIANQCARNDVDCSKGRIRANVNNSTSTTSISTNETNEISNNRTMLKHISTLRRSNSSTTSCSAATTSSSSANSISSQMNTRENSVSSLKPSNTTNMKRIKINEGMEKSNEQKPADNSNSTGRMTAKNSRKSKQKKISESKKIQNKPPPTSSESEEAEEEQNKVSLQTVSTAKLPRQRVLQSKQIADKPPKLNSQQKQNKSKPTVPLPTSSASESDKTRLNAALKLSKEVNLRRPKLVDNGQFDNNPFKTLHLHDSDSEMESSARSTSNASEEAQTNRHLLQQKTQINRQLAKTDNKVKQNVDVKKTIAKKVTVEKTQKKRDAIVRKPIKESSEQGVANRSNTQCQKLPNSKAGKNDTIRNQLSDDRHLLPDAKVKHLPGQISNRKNKNDNRLLTGETTTGCQSKRNVVVNNTSNTHSAVNNQSKNDNRVTVRNCETKCATHETQQRTPSAVETKNSSKRSLRSKKSTQKQQKLCLSLHKDCCSGIPDNMGYFNSNEVNAAKSSYPTTNAATGAINTVSPNFDNSDEFGPVNASITVPNGRQRFSTNVSIMDQLNRGVQVENLSLPPGITLTKVDPIKSEQLRQKSESIKKLAKPLQTQPAIPTATHAFHHPGATIIAPPVTPMSSYYSAPYASVASTAAIDPQSGIIMVEAKSNPTCKLQFKNPSCSAKQSKNKKRRNKSKPNKNGCDGSTQATADSTTGSNNGQTKIITLRNPMFHGGPVAAAANILNQPGILPGRSAENYTLPNTLPLDQPAAIIKNDNGMYTIRNPALHHAVTNGLALGGYRQFGNVNYYTPQEAAAEAAKATQKQKRQQQSDIIQPASGSSTAFSYFSNDSLQNNASGAHNNISISCTSISESITSNSSGSRLSGDAAVIARPTSAQKCISAIGSEIKNAQQQKRKSKEQTWTLPSLLSNDNLNSNTSFTMGVGRKSVSQAAADLSLQEKYQQSKYYNGFDVFASRSGGGTHMHHSCGDDSPPPITGYTGSYLDGIPNTGVIRYDDASFLKNLIPGQNLNNEVSIHNVDDTSFARNASSPSAHRVEITPVYSTRPSSAQLYDSPGRGGDLQQTVFRTTTNFRNHLNDFNKDSAMFSSTDLHLNLSEFESTISYEYESATSAGAASRDGEDNHNSILDFNNLLPKKGPNTTHRASPYLDDFVQNMNNLQISASSDEQISQLNGSNSARSRSNTNVNAASNWW
uniref:Uncharacterized protein n=1 Tax=Glossina palpalis gambiensis TaxID=67801 RepID=A0A1B0C0V3_9MUSC